jgi:hypothetical protein
MANVRDGSKTEVVRARTACPLYPQEQTSSGHPGMSVSCQKTDYRTLTITRYLQVIGGDLVGEAARVDVPFWSQSAQKMACAPVRLIRSLFVWNIRLSARLSTTAEPRRVAWSWTRN